MTRFLSEALQVSEPAFRLELRTRRSPQGNSAADIRLTAQIKQELRTKLRELGLDPTDTSPRELYHCLQERMRDDDSSLTRALQTLAATHVSAEADAVAGIAHTMREVAAGRTCYAIKNTSFKSIIRKMPPKNAMKKMGYRSVASFLKHEPSATILAVATLTEDERWQKNLLSAYKKLTPRDFEARPITIEYADCCKWKDVAKSAVAQSRQNVLCFKELGAIVLFPLYKGAQPGIVTANIVMAVMALNEIAAASTHWKLAQVRSDFGAKIHQSLAREAQLAAGLLGQPVSWHVVQRYYSQLEEHFNETFFEPHVQLKDMGWHQVEKVLSRIEPTLAFWHNMAHLGLIDKHKPVSCNILDVALNLCHNLQFEERLIHSFQHSLWQELQLRYLHPDLIEGTLLNELHPGLAAEYAIA